MTDSATPFSVNFWGSHPSAGNDDCYTGEDFATYDEAYDAFHAKATGRDAHRYQFIELTGDDGTALGNAYIVRPNPDHDAGRCARESAAHDAADRSEHAMQAGMAFGCAGFNDAMGW